MSCPDDSNGDTNCGRILCPYCGVLGNQTSYAGEQWPHNEAEAAGPIPEELWDASLTDTYEPPEEELDAHYKSIAGPYGGAL